MRVNIQIIRVNISIYVFALASILAFQAAAARADTPLTASVVMQEMSAEQRVGYIAGVVEGLAYSRYIKDNTQIEGMKCIYDWFYEAEGTRGKIRKAFQEFGEYQAGAIIAAMTKKACGE